jgi:hypothetical protein
MKDRPSRRESKQLESAAANGDDPIVVIYREDEGTERVTSLGATKSFQQAQRAQSSGSRCVMSDGD